jgi:hypothetical protein
MEAIMPRSSTQLVIGIAAAIAMMAISVSTIGTAIAESTGKETQAPPKKVLTNRYETQSSETDFRLGEHQQLRRIFLDGNRLR